MKMNTSEADIRLGAIAGEAVVKETRAKGKTSSRQIIALCRYYSLVRVHVQLHIICGHDLVAQNKQALDHGGQFPDITRPVVVL